MRAFRRIFNAVVFCGFFMMFVQEPTEWLALSPPLVGLFCLDAFFLLYTATKIMLGGLVWVVIALNRAAPDPIRYDPPARFVRPRFVGGRWSHAVSQE